MNVIQLLGFRLEFYGGDVIKWMTHEFVSIWVWGS